MSAPRGRWWYRVLPLAFFVGATAILVGPHLHPFTALGTRSYAPQDAWIFWWNSWWVRQYLAGGSDLFWTDRLLHPSGTSLAFHSFNLPYALLSIPFQAWSPGVSGLAVGFNAVVFLSFVASGVTAWALARQATHDRAAALVAGAVFAFLPFRVLNMARLHLLATEVLALYVLAWVHLWRRPTPARALGLAAAMTLAFYAAPEYALQLVLFSTGGLVLAAARRSRRLTARLCVHLAAAAAVFALAAAPLLAAQFRALRSRQVVGGYRLADAAAWSPALVSFVVPSRAHPLWGEALRGFGEYENDETVHDGMRSETSVSLTALVLAAMAAWRWRRSGALPWLLGAAFFFVLTLGPWLRLSAAWVTSIPLPYRLLHQVVPPLRQARDPTRFLPLAVLCLSVAAAFGVCALRRWLPPSAARLVVPLAVGLVLFESLTARAPAEPAAGLVHPFYHRIAREPGAFALLEPDGDHMALLAQTVHRHPTTGGGACVPRSTSRLRKLAVEADLVHPERVLRLAPPERERVVARDRRLLAEHRIRWAVFRLDERTEARLALLRLLGARVEVEPPLGLAEFPP
jgi:hypothetical protein